MGTAKRILAVVVMIFSILVLLLSLTGIAGTWMVRHRLNTDLVDIVTAAETRVSTTKQGLDRLEAMLVQARSHITSVEQDVQAFGADLEQNRPLLAAISDKVGLNLAPLLDSAREIMTTVRETVAAVDSAIEAINAIPFVSVPVPELERAKKLSQEVDNFRTEVQNLRTAIEERRSEIIGGAISFVTTPTSQLGSALDEMQATISDYGQQLSGVQEGLSAFKSAIRRWLTWTAVISTLILLWLAFSQTVLLVLGWRAFSNQPLLPGERRDPPTDS